MMGKSSGGAPTSTLTAYFSLMHDLRLREPNHPDLAIKYPDIVDQYRWDQPKKKWVLRANNSKHHWPPVRRTSRCWGTILSPCSPHPRPWSHLLRRPQDLQQRSFRCTQKSCTRVCKVPVYKLLHSILQPYFWFKVEECPRFGRCSICQRQVYC